MRTLHAATLSFLATTTVAGIAASHAPAAWRPHSAVAVRAAAIAQPLVVEADVVRAKIRCTVCGTVESILPVEGPATAFEFRVRMRDGTLRKSTVADAGKWRAGEAIMLIGPCVRQRTDSEGSTGHSPPVDTVIRPVSPAPGCPSPLESP